MEDFDTQCVLEDSPGTSHPGLESQFKDQPSHLIKVCFAQARATFPFDDSGGATSCFRDFRVPHAVVYRLPERVHGQTIIVVRRWADVSPARLQYDAQGQPRCLIQYAHPDDSLVTVEHKALHGAGITSSRPEKPTAPDSPRTFPCIDGFPDIEEEGAPLEVPMPELVTDLRLFLAKRSIGPLARLFVQLDTSIGALLVDHVPDLSRQLKEAGTVDGTYACYLRGPRAAAL